MTTSKKILKPFTAAVKSRQQKLFAFVRMAAKKNRDIEDCKKMFAKFDRNISLIQRQRTKYKLADEMSGFSVIFNRSSLQGIVIDTEVHEKPNVMKWSHKR